RLEARDPLDGPGDAHRLATGSGGPRRGRRVGARAGRGRRALARCDRRVGVDRDQGGEAGEEAGEHQQVDGGARSHDGPVYPGPSTEPWNADSPLPRTGNRPPPRSRMRPIRVAFDYRPALLGSSGIPRAARELARALTAVPGIDLRAFGHCLARARRPPDPSVAARLRRWPLPG